MELYARVRRAVLVEGMSRRAAAREFGLARKTVGKMLEYSVPPGYRRQQPVRRPKLGPWRGVIDAIWKRASNGRPSRGTRRSGSSSGCGSSTASAAANTRTASWFPACRSLPVALAPRPIHPQTDPDAGHAASPAAQSATSAIADTSLPSSRPCPPSTTLSPPVFQQRCRKRKSEADAVCHFLGRYLEQSLRTVHSNHPSATTGQLI